MSERRFIILLLLLVLGVRGLQAQSELTLYRMDGVVPQASKLNPSFLPDYKMVIGLPALSQYYSADFGGLSFNKVFRYNQFDSLVVDTTSLGSKLKSVHRMSWSNELQLFFYGFRIGKNFFSLGIDQVSDTRLSFPGSLLGWATFGPGNNRYAGQDLLLTDFSGTSLLYDQVTLGFARPFFKRITLGGRLHLINGLAAVSTGDLKGSLHVGIDSVSVQSTALRVQTAGVDFFNQSGLGVTDFVKYATNSGNFGMSLDVGATFRVNNRLKISASLLNLGGISWKNYTRAYEVDPVNYTFKGFDVNDYLFSKNTSGPKAQVDSLKNLFNGKEVPGNKFSTALIPKAYVGVSYQLGKKHQVSGVAYTDFYKGHVNPAAGVSYALTLGRILQTVISASFSNGQLSNIGAGISLKLGPLQIYSATDRVNAFFYPSRSSWANTRTGINLVFGKGTKEKDLKEKEEQEQEEEVEPAPLDSTAVETTIQADTTMVEETMPEPTPTVNEPDSSVQVRPVSEEPVAEQAVPEQAEPIPAMVPADTARTLSTPVIQPSVMDADYYVVVGVFSDRTNAAAYVEEIKKAGYSATIRFVDAKQTYCVTVFSSGNVEEARKIRDQYRGYSQFQFKDAWVMTIER